MLKIGKDTQAKLDELTEKWGICLIMGMLSHMRENEDNDDKSLRKLVEICQNNIDNANKENLKRMKNIRKTCKNKHNH